MKCSTCGTAAIETEDRDGPYWWCIFCGTVPSTNTKLCAH